MSRVIKETFILSIPLRTEMFTHGQLKLLNYIRKKMYVGFTLHITYAYYIYKQLRVVLF